MIRWGKALAVILTSAGALVLTWAILRPSNGASATTESPEDMPPVPVQVAPLRAGRLSETVHAYGVVRPRADQAVTISAPFDVVVRAVRSTPGEPVEAGEILAEIEPTAEAVLQLRQAEDALHAADRNLEQAHRRRDEQLATNADVSSAEQTRQAARTQIDALKARGIGSTKTLTAPAAGTVAAVNVQPGQTATVGTVLVTLTPPGALEARVAVDPSDLASIKVGQAVALHATSAVDAVPLQGVVRQIARALDPQTRLADVLVTLPPDAALLDGTFVEASFVAKTADGWAVPRAATDRDGDDWTLFTVEDGHAVRHVVRLGLAEGDRVQVIADDLHDGDAVIVQRNGELADKSAVTEEASATPPADDALKSEHASDAPKGGT